MIRIWKHLSRRRKRQFYLLSILMVLASITEVISVGAVLPFLAVLTSPEQIYNHELIQPLIQILKLTEPSQLILPLTILFIASALLAGIIRLILLYAMTKLSYATGADLSISIYQRTLYQNYATHVSSNSSQVINGIITKTNAVISTITSSLIIIISIILMISIIGVLLTIDFKVAITASIGFVFLYWGVIFYTRKRIKENSQTIADESTLMIKSLQEGLGGIRDVLINGSQQFYCNIYRNADQPFRLASGNNTFIIGSPRFVVEAIGMSLIAVLAYIMTKQDEGMTTAIPILGVLAFGAQRLLPAFQQLYAAYTGIQGHKASIEDVMELLEQPLPDYASQPKSLPIRFEKEIVLKNLSFRYNKAEPWVVKNLNLTIPKGARIGFMGETGVGKSTLVDIIMGLLSPSEGEIIIDNESINDENRRTWQVHIAHVPQSIYLSDNSIEENIAFGIPTQKINKKQVESAAHQARLAELIEGWSEGYKVLVGEQGVRLSGGQRQRVGIARALYRKANVLIFDEATSALDSETEYAVMEAIEGLDKDLTVLIIAHRLTTLKDCDTIVRLNKDKTIHIGSYHEMVKS